VSEWAKEEPRPHASLAEKGEEVHPLEVPQVDELERWATLLGYDEPLMLEDLILDREGTEAWEESESEAQQGWLMSLLGELPAAQRQAFLLHALED
jgi:DNA-directed RNA polymerase specialized sigma24 family protein